MTHRVLGIVALVGCFLAPALVGAQELVRVDHYRVLPRYSYAHQTGGFGGFDIRYRLLGDYDFQVASTPIGRAAIFDEAEIWGSIVSPFPTIAIVLDVDEALNLEGIRGHQLPLGAPFDAYQFLGETGDGSSVRLLAVTLGPWMYVRGGTMAPPGSADFFEYDVRWVARTRPWADLNGDGVVDAADYTVARETGGASLVGGLADWRNQFGEVPNMAALEALMGSAAAAASIQFSSASAVPEPATLIMVLSPALMLLVWYRRR